jgi:hypothetical protein
MKPGGNMILPVPFKRACNSKAHKKTGWISPACFFNAKIQATAILT